MTNATTASRNYWPYDEVTAGKGRSSKHFSIQSPWVSAEISVRDADIPRVSNLLEKISSRALGPSDLDEMNWLFSSLAAYPLAYTLPRFDFSDARDVHVRSGEALDLETPARLFSTLTSASEETRLSPVSAVETGSWKWDTEAALDFSRVPQGHDPVSIFSVARRFHLLDSVEENRTEDLVAYVKSLAAEPARFREASAFVVRQNHYVTQKCRYALRPALEIAQNAVESVKEFMQAEAGHDVLLGRAMRDLGVEPESVPIIDSIVALMVVFHLAAKRNLLAFAMIVDMFERSSYRETDPLADLLASGGETTAGKHIDTHREINDSGEHENVAAGFLSRMAPVDADYATEAMRIMEVATMLMHSVSKETLERLRAEAK